MMMTEQSNRTRRTKPKKTATGKRKAVQRSDLYQDVTDKIVAELEQGNAPWVCPWDAQSTACQIGLPRNAVTDRCYSGINILLLWGAVIEKNFPSQIWLTYKQAKALGGYVREGEQGEVICYADQFISKDERKAAKQEQREPIPTPFLKRYRVFNIAQCEGLEIAFANNVLKSNAAQPPECEIVPRAEALSKATGAHIHIGGNRAYYAPNEDYIQLPPQPAFRDQINYYRTHFHELGHWTGHKSRLDRPIHIKRSKTSKEYAQEELVAELTAAFVCASLSIVPTVRHADYLANYLEHLKSDKRAIFKAASAASKATDYLLAFENQTDNRALSRVSNECQEAAA